MTIAKISLHCILKVIFLRGDQFDPQSYFKKSLSNISKNEYNFTQLQNNQMKVEGKKKFR